MKEIFDWLREQISKESWLCTPRTKGHYSDDAVFVEDTMKLIDEAEAKWKEKEAEFRASVIDEFAQKAKTDFMDYDMYLILHSNGIMGPKKSMEYYKYMIDDFARELKGEPALSFEEARIKAQKFNEAQPGIDSDFSDELRNVLKTHATKNIEEADMPETEAIQKHINECRARISSIRRSVIRGQALDPDGCKEEISVLETVTALLKKNLMEKQSVSAPQEKETLVPLPCKPGDHVWALLRDDYVECEVTSMTIYENNPHTTMQLWTINEEYRMQACVTDFGYSLFHTEEEVKAAYEELQTNRNSR